MEFEINGVAYRSKLQPKRKPRSPMIDRIVAMASMYSSLMYSSKKPASPETPNCDIIDEYALIQQKKSRLSRNQRDWIVYQFEKRFEKVEIIKEATNEP